MTRTINIYLDATHPIRRRIYRLKLDGRLVKEVSSFTLTQLLHLASIDGIRGITSSCGQYFGLGNQYSDIWEWSASPGRRTDYSVLKEVWGWPLSRVCLGSGSKNYVRGSLWVIIYSVRLSIIDQATYTPICMSITERRRAWICTPLVEHRTIYVWLCLTWRY